MIVANLPTYEQERLADLRALRILDTPPEQRFDRVVKLAAKVYDAPIAYVAMIDADRQWLKAAIGLRERQTPRSMSFCGHTILQDQPLIVPDTTRDDRFRNNPMVIGPPHVRFYAGHPLRGPQGHNVATLCLADTRPRTFSDHDLEVFQQLAQLAEHELNMVDLIGTQRHLLDVQSKLTATQKALARELEQAAAYVKSLLPEPMQSPPSCIRTDYRFIASSQLGGDLFGYHWLSESQLAIYLLDVTGHGLAASLLSATVASTLGRDGLFETDRSDPGAVLTALNRSFPMEKNNGRFFTLWYGVYHTDSRTLAYASGGHPPAIVLTGEAPPILLGEPSYMIGIDPDAAYDTREHHLAPGSLLYVFSDGAIEAMDSAGRSLRLTGFVDLLRSVVNAASPARVDGVLQALRLWQARDDFEDDLSLLEIEFA